MRVRPLALFLALAFVFSTPAPAQTKDETKRALALGREALSAYNKADWTDARAKFQAAEELAHSPVFVLYFARSARNAGDLDAAKEAYDKVATETVSPSAPAPWAAAVVSAKQEREELLIKIAEAKAAASANASASVSAQVAAATASAEPSASAVASPTASATSASSSVPSVLVTSLPTTLPTASIQINGPQPGSLVPGLAMMSLGAVGLGIGVGMFVHAKSTADGILDRCQGNICLKKDEPLKNSIYGIADGATAAFAVGGLMLVGGIVLVIVRPGGKQATPGATVKVAPGWSSLRVSGEF